MDFVLVVPSISSSFFSNFPPDPNDNEDANGTVNGLEEEKDGDEAFLLLTQTDF